MKLEVVERTVRKQVWTRRGARSLSPVRDEVLAYLDSLDIASARTGRFSLSSTSMHSQPGSRPRNRPPSAARTASLVHPREVFKSADSQGSQLSIILAHNHPSGDPAPSKDDIDLTHRLVEAGGLMGIDVLDHVIVAPPGESVSMKELGIL